MQLLIRVWFVENGFSHILCIRTRSNIVHHLYVFSILWIMCFLLILPFPLLWIWLTIQYRKFEPPVYVFVEEENLVIFLTLILQCREQKFLQWVLWCIPVHDSLCLWVRYIEVVVAFELGMCHRVQIHFFSPETNNSDSVIRLEYLLQLRVGRFFLLLHLIFALDQTDHLTMVLLGYHLLGLLLNYLFFL